MHPSTLTQCRTHAVILVTHPLGFLIHPLSPTHLSSLLKALNGLPTPPPFQKVQEPQAPSGAALRQVPECSLLYPPQARPGLGLKACAMTPSSSWILLLTNTNVHVSPVYFLDYLVFSTPPHVNTGMKVHQTETLVSRLHWSLGNGRLFRPQECPINRYWIHTSYCKTCFKLCRAQTSGVWK